MPTTNRSQNKRRGSGGASRYAFGAGAALYRQNVHPRVLLGPDDVTRLQRQILSGDGEKIMRALRRKVRPLTTQILACDDIGTMLERLLHNVVNHHGDTPTVHDR